jgi:antirestriction protein ArdC
VFNVEQIDGLDMTKYPVPRVEVKNRDQRDPELEAAFARYGVPYSEGGNGAYYNPASDSIRMPAFADFVSGNAFYATLAHEGIHNAVTRIMPHGDAERRISADQPCGSSA